MKKLKTIVILLSMHLCAASAEYFTEPYLGAAEHQLEFPNDEEKVRSRIILADKQIKYVNVNGSNFSIVEGTGADSEGQVIINIDANEFGGDFLVDCEIYNETTRAYLFQKQNFYRFIVLKKNDGVYAVDTVCEVVDERVSRGDYKEIASVDLLSNGKLVIRPVNPSELDVEYTFNGGKIFLNDQEHIIPNYRTNLTLTPAKWREHADLQFASEVKSAAAAEFSTDQNEFEAGIAEYLKDVPADDKAHLTTRLQKIKDTPIEQFVGLSLADGVALAAQLNLSYKVIKNGNIVHAISSDELNRNLYFVVDNQGVIEYVNVLPTGPTELSVP